MPTFKGKGAVFDEMSDMGRGEEWYWMRHTHVMSMPSLCPDFWLGWKKFWCWSKQNKRRNKLSFNRCSVCPWVNKIETSIGKVTMQLWNLREASWKYKGGTQTKRMNFFGKVLPFNSLKWDGKHLITLTFIVLKSSSKISLLWYR